MPDDPRAVGGGKPGGPRADEGHCLLGRATPSFEDQRNQLPARGGVPPPLPPNGVRRGRSISTGASLLTRPKAALSAGDHRVDLDFAAGGGVTSSHVQAGFLE